MGSHSNGYSDVDIRNAINDGELDGPRFMNERSPFIPLVQPPQGTVATSDLQGAGYSGAYGLDITGVSPRRSPR